jgi:hypothetical protein
MGDSLTRGSRRDMFKFFNTTMETFFGKPMSAGGVHGATYWGGGYEAVIKYFTLHSSLFHFSILHFSIVICVIFEIVCCV